ncbi:hypothetical protein [Pseudidiomarina sp.]|uniref:hypothetical protein n=1 Tax=Pseudidiomarina sp. TaxID=2081707 RepID=UPI003A96A61E
MSFWDFFTRKNKTSFENRSRSAIASKSKNLLSRAKEAKQCALEALEEGNHDEAWRKFHEQKRLFAQLGIENGSKILESLALDSSVHEHLAKVLRVESKHEQALMNITYFLLASGKRDPKLIANILAPYIENSESVTVELSEAVDDICSYDKVPDIKAAQQIISAWSVPTSEPWLQAASDRNKTSGDILIDALVKAGREDERHDLNLVEKFKHDIAVMKRCCAAELRMMERTEHLAAPSYFLRVAILSNKAKDYESEIEYCEAYILAVERHYKKYGTEYRYDVREGPTYKAMVARLPKAADKLRKSRKNS